MLRRILPLFVALIATLPLLATDAIKWSSDFPAIPDDYGYAGAFAGVIGKGEERTLVVSGGANFPDADPFASNIGKAWHDTVFTIPLKGATLTAAGEWSKSPVKLPQTLGYGASATLPHHGTSLFIGGSYKEDGTEIFSPAVYEVSLENGNPVFTEVAALPAGTSYFAAATIGKNVYVFSGQGADGAIEQALILDTSSDNRSTWAWKNLAWPEYSEGVPARARAHYTLGTIGGKLYVFGGRAKQLAGDHRVHKDDVNDIYGTDGFRDCYEYSPGAKDAAAGSWKRIADLPTALSAAPSQALPAGVSHLLVLGGVDLATLVDLQNKEKYPTLNDARHGFDHPGFPRAIHGYHAITNTWSDHGSIPADVKAPVTAPVVIVGKEFVVPSGEWSPKLRSAQVLSGTVEGKKLGFGVINWIVVVVYLGAMVGIGYWFMKREAASSTEAYFRGGQKIPWWVAGLSIFATMLSAITFMAIPGTAYATNWNGYIGQWPILVIVPLVVMCYLPFYRRLNITTAYQYLERRFNVASRVIASITFMLFHIGRVAIVLYLPALALSSVTTINIYAAIIVIGVLCVIYTVMGGIEAVVWTDAIQAMVLIGGALLCFGLVVFQVEGGLGTITDAMMNQSKGITASFSISDISITKSGGAASGIVLFIAFLFANLPSYTAGQDVVQRYVTTPSEKEAARSLWMNIVMVLVGSAIFFALGTALYVFYTNHPDMLDPAMPAKDGILPYFIMQNLPVGVAGLIIAGVFAAAQSTISSSLNSVATAFVTDVYGRLIKPESTDQQRLGVARNVVIGLGTVGIIVSSYIALTKVDSAFMLFNTFIGFALGPLGGLFALGIFTKHSSGKAGLLALLCGVASVVTIHVMNTNGAIDVMPLLYGFFGFMSTFISGFVLGFIFPAKAHETDGLTILTQKKG